VRLEPDAIERILSRWPVARMATLDAAGRPELVPIVFALCDGALWTPVDGKPKRGGELARVRNLRRDGRVSLLFDHYDDDWERLWWLRVDGRGEVVPARGPAAERALAALRAKYPHYASGATPLTSGEPTLIRIDVERRIGWAARAGLAIC